MPVLMADSTTTQFRPSERDMDKLVEEVRERLCLKSREKLNAARRSMPYSGNGAARRKGSAFVLSSENCDSAHGSSHGAQASAPKRSCGNCTTKCGKCKCSDSSNVSGNPNLLKQLLAEHRLIQEAVRRIHVLHQYGDASSASVEPPSPCSARSSSTDSMDSSTFSSTTDL